MSTSNRYEHIDALRGVAALSVLYYHIAEFLPAQNAFEKHLFFVMVDKTDFGKIAVTLFFAISGFVIPFSLFKPSTKPLTDFAISRFFRLYPAYWLSIVLAVLLYSRIGHSHFQIKQILVNVTMLQQFVGVPNVIGVYWTLQVELIFYVLCAAMFALGVLQKPKFVVFFVWILIAASFVLGLARHMTGKNLPVAIPMALSVMYFGFLWRALIMQNATSLRKSLYGILAGFVVIWPAVLFLAYDRDNHMGMNYLLTYYIAIGIFVLGTTKIKITSKIAAYLGRISYSLYLIGSPARVLSVYLLKVFFGSTSTFGVMVLATIIGIGAASLIYRYLEKPCIALGRSLSHSLKKSAPPSQRDIEESEVL